MNRVRLHCVVCENSLDYFKYLLANYRTLASDRAEITVVAHCTDDESYHAVGAQKLADRIVPVHRRPEFYVYGNRHDVINRIKLLIGAVPKLSGSSGHAAGLNSAFRASGDAADPDSFDIIADTDTVIVVRDWDVVLSGILKRCAIIGTSYEQKGGATSGNGMVQTYKTSPNLTWVAFSARYPFRDLDAGHMLWRNLPIRTASQAALYGLTIGESLLRDVGWKIPQFLKDQQAAARIFTHHKPQFGDCRVLRAVNNYNEEFQLDGVPFIVHQRGSRKHAFRSQPLSAPFYDAAEAYIATLAPSDSGRAEAGL